MVMSKSTTCFKYRIKQSLLAAVINNVSEAIVMSYYIRAFFASMYDVRSLSGQRLQYVPGTVIGSPNHHFKANCISVGDKAKPKIRDGTTLNQALA